jgi:cytochrome P450
MVTVARSVTAPILGGHWYRADPAARSGLVDRGTNAAPLAGAPALGGLPAAPRLPMHPLPASLRIVRDQGGLLFPMAAEFGEVVRLELLGGARSVVVISNPAHVKAVLTADPAIAPSATGTSPLRPIVGADSVLTAVGERHRQQRALLMPQFHGRAVAAYRDRIDESTARRLDRWPLGEPVRLADLAQRITLDVIMAAVFGIESEADAGPVERRLRAAVVRLLRLSNTALATVAQLTNARSPEPVGLTRLVLGPVDRAVYEVIAQRRAEGDGDRTDILSVLLRARTEAGEPLADSEVRDELLTLVLAGHETTSNTVAWTFERLTRHPEAYAKAVESAEDPDYLEALINESMRTRPVVPIVARQLLTPWRFGDFRVEAGRTALVSILLLHHRDDLYPHPFAFDPERFYRVRPVSHGLLPFGGGDRRCLGATLAMAELRTVLREILLRVGLQTHDRPGERPRHRNVTMIPSHGGVVTALSKR